MTKITATFVHTRIQDSGSENTLDYTVYVFTDITGADGTTYPDKWIKETKLMKKVPFRAGKKYEITLSDGPFSSMRSVNLPYPVAISWDNERVYIKGGNAIIVVDAKGNEKNLSIPSNKIYGTNNYETAARNKFEKGILTEELLLKMNDRGVFFYVNHYDPQDKRVFSDTKYGLSRDQDKGNYILIQKETQDEIDRGLKRIKANYLNPQIEKHFKIIEEILPPKKRRK